MRNSRLLRVFGLVAFLLAMVHTSVWGGHGNTTHYGKVTVSKTGEGTVYIAKSDNATSGNMEESWDCNGNENNDSKTFYLFAKPAEGYMFKNWTGSGTSSNNPYEITPEAASTNSGSPTPFDYTANFEKVLCSATVKVAADGGTATVDGEQSSTKQSSASKDTFSFKLEATANEGYKFKGWANSLEGNIGPTDNPLTREITCDTAKEDEDPNKTEYWFAIFEQEGQSTVQQHINPVLDARVEDPAVFRAQDGFYYMYCSELKKNYNGQGNGNNAGDGNGIPVWRSSDMINWNYIGGIVPKDNNNNEFSEGRLLSPEISYLNGKYVLYYGVTSKSGNTTNAAIYVATSEKPYGPFIGNTMLYNAEHAQDPSLFKDDDGKLYLIMGHYTGIYYLELNTDGKSKKVASATASKLGNPSNNNNRDWTKIKAPIVFRHNAEDKTEKTRYYYIMATKSNGKDDTNTQLVAARGEGGLSGDFFDQCNGTSTNSNYNNGKGRYVFRNSGNEGKMLSVLETNENVVNPAHNSHFLMSKDGKSEWVFYQGKETGGDENKLFINRVIWNNTNWSVGFPCLLPPTKTDWIDNPEVDTETQESQSEKISNADQLVAFAKKVNEGDGLLNAVLTADIDCSGIDWVGIGTDKFRFQGQIDGQKHHIKNLRSAKALVAYASSGAVFKNIVIDASCEFVSEGDNVAAFVNQAIGGNKVVGNITFENCGNDAHVKGNANTSGFVGKSTNLNISWNTCYNAGYIEGTSTSAAFCGSCTENASRKLTLCWNSGIVSGYATFENKKRILVSVSNKKENNVTMTNSFELVVEDSDASKPVGYADSWLGNGHFAFYLNDVCNKKVVAWYQKLGVDVHPMPFSCGSGDIVYKAMGCDKKHATTGGFSEGGYTNSSRGASHAYEFELSSTELSKKCKNCSNLYSSITVPVNAGWLEVSDANQMEMTMDYVNSGSEYNSIKSIDAKIRLMNDIDFTGKGTKMYGVEKANYRFAGQFDGKFHKVTINYVANGDFTALFRSTFGATIKDLYVAGSITNNGGYTGCGGVVGFANTPTIEKCLSSVSYSDSKSSSHTGYFGGIIGKATLASPVELKNCGFVGTVSAPNATDNGGLVGTIVNANRLTVKNSYVAANINWKSGEEICNAGKKTDCYSYAPNSKEVTGGQLCYDLNNGQTSKVWKQSIGVQPYPIFSGGDVDMVVDVNNDEKFYYNGIYTRIKNEEKEEYFTPGDWFTICIPYGSAFIEGGEVYSIAGLGKNSENNPSSLKLYSHEQMVAGTPYICRATDNTFKVYYTAAEAKEAGIVNGLWGTFEDFPFSEWSDYEKEEKDGAGVYVLTGNMLKRASSKSGVKANRAFVVMSKVKDIARDQAGVKMLTLGFEGMEDDVQTAVDEIKTVDITSTPVYNLQGQRVQNPSHGIFIVNGKKVYIK